MNSEVGFEGLEVWQEAVKLASEIYSHFVSHKDFGFKDQITRSALSVASNIAEGYERYFKKEKHHFYSIARGSAGELRTQIKIGIEIGYITPDQGEGWLENARRISSMISGLMNSVKTH